MNNIFRYDKNIENNEISIFHTCSWYLINNSNNLFVTSIGVYTLTKGNYSASQFCSMLNSILGIGWNLSINTNTNKLTLTYTSSFTILPSSTCYTILGFLKNTTYYSTSNSFAFPNCCNFLGINRLRIKSNVLQAHNLDSVNNGRSNILCTIPVNNGVGGLLLFLNQMNFKTLFPNKNLDYIDIQITDEYDNLIDFNGVDLFITIQINTVRKFILQLEDLSNLMSDEIKDSNYLI